MKKVFVVFTLLVAGTICSFGQTDQLYISVVQPERSEISAEAGKQLERKMTQLLTANGISSQDANNRFVITAKVDITSKDIVASTPQRISEKMDITFLVGDVVENKVFETILNDFGINLMVPAAIYPIIGATYAAGIQIARETKQTVNMYNIFEIDVVEDDKIILTPLAYIKQWLKDDSKKL